MTDNNKLNALINCKKCNRVFSSVDGGLLCSRCNENVDTEFDRVREYIYDNPTSSVKDVSMGTGVSADSILKWIRDGRIVLGDHANIAFCERCSEPTDGMRFCPKCIRELSSGLKAGIGENNQKHTAGMHIKDREKNKK